jgi:hypothetical protein
MSTFNTTGYRPDPVLAKQMAGGGFGSLMTNIGGAFKNLYETANANSQWNAEQEIRKINARINEANAKTNAMHAKTNTDRLQYGIERDKLSDQQAIDNLYSTMISQNDLLANHGDGRYGYGAVMPSREDFGKMSPEDRTSFAAQWNSLAGGVKGRMDADKLAQERADKVLDSIADKEWEAYKMALQADIDQQKPQQFSTKTITNPDGTQVTVAYNPKNPQEAKPIAGTKSWVKPFNPDTDRINLKETKQKVNSIIKDAVRWRDNIGRVSSFFNDGRFDGNQEANVLKKFEQLRKDPRYKDTQSEWELLKIAAEEFGLTPNGWGRFELTDKAKAQQYVQNALSSNPSMVSVDDLVQAGVVKDAEEGHKMKQSYEQYYNKSLQESQKIEDFVNKHGLDSSPVTNFFHQVGTNGVGILATLETIASKVNGGGKTPRGTERYWRDKHAQMEQQGDKWSMGNNEVDIGRLTGEIASYLAPTFGMSLSIAKTIAGTMVKNAIKFGAAEGLVAGLYNRPYEEIMSSAMYGGVGGGVVGGAFKAGQKGANAAGNIQDKSSQFIRNLYDRTSKPKQ